MRAARAVASVRVGGSIIRPMLQVASTCGMRACYFVGVIAQCGIAAEGESDLSLLELAMSVQCTICSIRLT
jgi:hypothetical protein